MSLRTYLDLLNRTETLLEIEKPVSKRLQGSRHPKRPLSRSLSSFESIEESRFSESWGTSAVRNNPLPITWTSRLKR